MRDLISASIAAISRYSPASSSCSSCISSMYCMYWRVISAIGMSRMSRFCRRIRYSSRSSGPSNASRNTSSASGGMYRSRGSSVTGSPSTIGERHLAPAAAAARPTQRSASQLRAGVFDQLQLGLHRYVQSHRLLHVVERLARDVARLLAALGDDAAHEVADSPRYSCARCADGRDLRDDRVDHAAACSRGSRCRPCGSPAAPRPASPRPSRSCAAPRPGISPGSPGSVRRTRAGSVCMVLSFFATASGSSRSPIVLP